MVTKNSPNFSSCDVTKNLGAGKVGNTLFLGRYFQEKKTYGRTGIPKVDATENIFHIKDNLICSTGRSYAERLLAQWS